MRIEIYDETLTDNSRVTNVTLRCGNVEITLHPATQLDAHKLAEKLQRAIEEHTVDEAKVSW